MSSEPSGTEPEPRSSTVAGRDGTSQRSDVARKARTAAWVALAVVVTVFLLSNAQAVEVDFVITSVEMPLWIVLGATLMLGAALAAGFIGLRSHRRSRARRSSRRSTGPSDAS